MQSKLNFEKPLIELEKRIQRLKDFSDSHPEIDISKGLMALENNVKSQTRKIFKGLSRWDKVQLARHEQRPQSFSYIEAIFDDPVELHGDKYHGDDRALIGGCAWFQGQPVVYLAQQKGRNLKERQEMSFGYTHPEGYRKARRLMKLAEKFDRPIISLVDTPGAHFDRGSEERGQSVAIAENLAQMASLSVPMLVVVIGEGGSGGALAIAAGDRVLMMEYAVYCVAPPEACSGIVWKDNGEHAPEATEGYKPIADDLIELGVIDEIIREPLGGAHRNPAQSIRNVKRSIKKHLSELVKIDKDTLAQKRYDRYRKLGVYGESSIL